VAERYEYDAWGNVLGVFDGNGGSLPSSVLGNRYLFQGREYSWATHAAWGGAGLYYFRARWYDPSTGRWLSNDPIGISGGLNQYAFCANNPVMFVDPEGLEAWVGTTYNGTTLGDHSWIVVDDPRSTTEYTAYSIQPGRAEYITGHPFRSLWTALNDKARLRKYDSAEPDSTFVRLYTTKAQDEILRRIGDSISSQGDCLPYHYPLIQCVFYTRWILVFIGYLPPETLPTVTPIGLKNEVRVHSAIRKAIN
jgi:RHS repeat-associated protein